jgi:hypothetical protein
MRDWLLVASRQDTSALWAFERLNARGRPCQVVLTEALQSSEVRWLHSVSSRGAGVTMTLADGRRIDSGNVAAVLNRALSAPLTLMAQMQWPDSDYARSEESAFALSWLQALAPVVVNPPAARGLAGAWRSRAEWSGLARRAGLDCAPHEADSHDPGSVHCFPQAPQNGLVIGERAFGLAARPEVRPAAIALAKVAGMPLLGLWLTDEQAPRLTMATPHPDLSLGGEPGIDALERVLSA